MGALLFASVPVVNNTVKVSEAPRPDIVFFLVDDVGWADLGCYGDRFYETRLIDELARQELRFTDAYATCHCCTS